MIQVAALWRHPIKSHGREALERVTLTQGQTMPWDRVWAVTHEATKFNDTEPRWMHCRNFMVGARTPGLVAIWATLDEQTRRITLRHNDLDELEFCPDNLDDNARFLTWVKPLCPDNRDGPVSIVSVEGRGMTDSAFPSISIMNTASHTSVVEALGTDIETARWRGNIWLDGLTPWEEHDWVGKKIRIGTTTLKVRERIKRCIVTDTNTITGVRDTATLNTLNAEFGHQDFGVYAEVIQSGDIFLGAQAELV